MENLGSVTISVSVLSDGGYAIVLEFDSEDLSIVLPPAVAEMIATNMISAVEKAKDMGWERDDDDDLGVGELTNNSNTDCN